VFASFLSFAASLSLGQVSVSPSSSSASAEKPRKSRKTKEAAVPEEKIVQTKHSLKIGGQEIKYTATAGTIC